MSELYTCTSGVIVYQGASAWRFLALPGDMAAALKATVGKSTRAWGSIPVTVTVGTTTWNTSLFPDSKSGTYLLPLRAAVRKSEKITDNAHVAFSFRLR